MPRTDTLPAELVLRIEGRDAPDDVREHIVLVEVQSRLFEPAGFSIRIDLDPAGRPPGDAYEERVASLLGVDASVEILHRTGGRDAVLIAGRVDTIELELGLDGRETSAFAIVRGRDAAHFALSSGARTRAYSDVKYSDVVSDVAREAGLRASAQSTSSVHAQVLQLDTTDWAFLVQLARRAGFVVYVENGTLLFGAPGGRDTIDLKWGEGLVSFQPELSLSRQTSRVDGNGRDPRSTPVLTKGVVSTTFSRAGSIDALALARPARDPKAAASSGAKGLPRVAGQGIVNPGNAALLPDCTARVRGMGDAFDMDVYVVATRHVFGADTGFVTHFELGDPTAILVAGEASAGTGTTGGASQGGPPVGDSLQAVTAVVVDNHDPEKLGRVRVTYPSYPDAGPSPWARVVVPQAGNDRGTWLMPDVGDEVLVIFGRGDSAAPFVLGSLWSESDPPPELDNEVSTDVSMIVTRSGHRLIFDDTPGDERIEIVDSTGANGIVIDTSNQQIVIQAQDDLTLKAVNGTLRLEGRKIEIVSTQSDVVIEAARDIRGKAAVKARMEGATLELDGSGMAVLTGGIVKIN